MAKKKANLEDIEQRTLFTWAEVQRLPPADDLRPGAKLSHYLFAVPNGGYRSKVEAAIMAGLGTRSGIPDVFLDLQRRGFAGLRLEMKKPRQAFRSMAEAARSVSSTQAERIALLRHAGYSAGVAFGYAEAHVAICDYLGLEPSPPILREALRGEDLGYSRDLFFQPFPGGSRVKQGDTP